jgi:hypothetical protein
MAEPSCTQVSASAQVPTDTTISSRQGSGGLVVDVPVGFGRSHPSTGHDPCRQPKFIIYVTAFVTYGAAEVQDAQREQLAAMRLTSYDPDALARLFEHGINQHLPDGITHRVNTSRYVTD